MQKFTIFTIVFSIIILSITAELVAQDYLQQLYPASNAANILRTLDDFDEPITDQDFDQAIEDGTETSSDAEVGNDQQEPEPEQETVETTEPSDVSTVKISEKVVSLLPSIDIAGLRYDPVNFSGKLFDIIPTTGVNPDDVAFGQLSTTDLGAIGIVYEFPFLSQQEARKFYVLSKAAAKDFSFIDVNETNQFGDNSFYLNHQAKVGEVFLVSITGNNVYAFAYKKELHETFKPFFGLLL